MAFTSRITDTIEIPGEPGQTITIRKLAHQQRSMAEDRLIEAKTQKLVAFGESVKFLPDKQNAEEAKKIEEDPRNKYDVATIVRCGVVGWSYTDAFSEDAVLDQDWVDWAFDQIIKFSTRSAADTKASANGSLPSTAPVVAVGQQN